ncbi:cysteine dioxygenase type 1-like [Styela clava]
MSTEVAQIGDKMSDMGIEDHQERKFYPKKNKNVVLPAPNNMDSMIKGLEMLFDSDHVNIDEVKRYMSEYKSNPSDWHKYAKFDAHKYTRNLVDIGNGKYNLILLCWGEGHGSSIHDHSDSHCFYKMLGGSLTETLYEWPKGKKKTVMKQKNSFSLKENEVGYINDSYGLHRVENKSHTERAVSLHLYSPPFDMCQSFDERSGHITRCKVTFWSKYGERTPYVKPCKPEGENN